MKYFISIAVSILIPGITFSQVGIGTDNPQQILHIDAAANNATAPADNRNNDDVVVTSQGKLGAGNIAPITKVDLRNASNENIIGIGVTNQSASSAGAGAVQYHESGSNWGLSYSNGSSWVFLPVVPDKALVYATKNTAQSIDSGGTTVTTIINWVENTDQTDSFDHSTGIFTAPRDGVYIVSVNLATQSGGIPNNSYTETIVQSNTTTGVPQFRCVNSYPGYTTGSATNTSGNNCTGIFYLKKGNTISTGFRHNFGSARNLAADSSLNTLTITQL